MEDVAAGAALWVHMGGWDELGSPVGSEPDLPAFVVHHPVMVTAQQAAVVHTRRPALDGRHNMMPLGLAPVSRTDTGVLSIILGADVA
jgi:hypothetical protein